MQLEHEFVNCQSSLKTRRAFHVRTEDWQTAHSPFQSFQQLLLELLKDWGTGLDLALYEQAVTHFLGTVQTVPVVVDGRVLGHQTVRLIAPDTLFKLTALSSHLDDFMSHAKRFLRHSGLQQIAWANITRFEVAFRCIRLTGKA